MKLIISPAGVVRCLYGEAIELASLGAVQIRRAGSVQPDRQGRWWADLSAVHGPKLGPYPLRSQALEAEVLWLEANRICSAEWIWPQGRVDGGDDETGDAGAAAPADCAAVHRLPGHGPGHRGQVAAEGGER